jgi:histone H3/H4
MSVHSGRTPQRGMSDRVVDAVTRNPEGLLLLAAGCALLLRSRSSSGSGGSAYAFSDAGQPRTSEYGRERHQPSSDLGMQKRVYDGAGAARDMAANVSERVQDSVRSTMSGAAEYAHDLADHASEYAQDAQRTASDYVHRVTDNAQTTFRDTVDYLVRERPLAIAVAGLAAGAAVAAAFRPTDFEKDALRPVGKMMNQMIEETSEKAKETAAKAGDRLKEAVEDPTKLKESVAGLVDDVNEAFATPGQTSGDRTNEGSKDSTGSTHTEFSGSRGGLGPQSQGTSPSGSLPRGSAFDRR